MTKEQKKKIGRPRVVEAPISVTVWIEAHQLEMLNKWRQRRLGPSTSISKAMRELIERHCK